MLNFLHTLKYSNIGSNDTAVICAQSLVGVLQEKHDALSTIRAYAAEEDYPEPDTFPRLLWWLRLVRKEATEAFIQRYNEDLKDYIADLERAECCLNRLGIAPNPN